MHRKILIPVAVIGLPVLLLAVAAVVVESIDPAPYVRAVADQVEDATGRRLSVDGGVDLDLLPRPGLQMRNVRLQNFATGTQPDMLVIDSLEAAISLLPLLTGTISVDHVTLLRPQVLLETDEQGNANWQLVQNQPDQETAAEPGGKPPRIRQLQIRDALLRYRDGMTGTEQVVALHALHVQDVGFDRTMTIRMDADLAGRPVQVEAELDSLASLLDARDTRFAVLANGQALEGHVRVQLQNGRTLVRGAVRFDVLDLDSLLPGAGNEGASRPPAARLFPEQVLPLEALQSVDVELRLEGRRLQFAGQSIESIVLQPELRQGRLHVQGGEAHIAQGRIRVDLSLAAASEPPELTLQLDGEEILLGEVVAAAGNPGLLSEASTNFSADLRTRGDSVAAWMRNLNGTLLLDAGAGTIQNKHLDLAGGDLLAQLFGSLIPGVKKDEVTRLRCAVASLEFQRGVAKYDRRVAMETEKMNVISSGAIDLGHETLDIGFVPKPRKDAPGIGFGAGDLVSVARLQGSLLEPELGIDKANTAKTGLKVYGAVATAGVSLLVGSLIEQKFADPNPCVTARHGPQQEEEPEGESTLDKVKKGFRKLLDF